MTVSPCDRSLDRRSGNSNRARRDEQLSGYHGGLLSISVQARRGIAQLPPFPGSGLPTNSHKLPGATPQDRAVFAAVPLSSPGLLARIH